MTGSKEATAAVLQELQSAIRSCNIPEPQFRDIMTYVKIACGSLVGIEKEADAGPWSLVGHVIQSDDFEHDVYLTVNGDFYSTEQKRAYMNALISKLNTTKE